jgi:hypothetical protein
MITISAEPMEEGKNQGCGFRIQGLLGSGSQIRGAKMKKNMYRTSYSKFYSFTV